MSTACPSCSGSCGRSTPASKPCPGRTSRKCTKRSCRCCGPTRSSTCSRSRDCRRTFYLLPAPAPVEWEPEAAAEEILLRADPDLRHGGDRAFYRPDADVIQLPDRGAFPDSASFYATALHELVHWTGHPKRLHRDLTGRFGDESYAMEELVAELGAAFLCASCRIDGRLQHDSYIASWLKVLRNDKRAIFVASTKAQNAADFLLPHVDPLTADAVKEAA